MGEEFSGGAFRVVCCVRNLPHSRLRVNKKALASAFQYLSPFFWKGHEQQIDVVKRLQGMRQSAGPCDTRKPTEVPDSGVLRSHRDAVVLAPLRGCGELSLHELTYRSVTVDQFLTSDAIPRPGNSL